MQLQRITGTIRVSKKELNDWIEITAEAETRDHRKEPGSDIFDYIQMFYNSKRQHGSGDQMSSAEYENQYYQ